MGGTRYNARGIDDEGNVANFVECEQLVLRTRLKPQQKRVTTYSYCQIRGSLPFYWTQIDGKVKVIRSIESSMEVFMKHAESIFNEYESDNILMVNLLAQGQPHEELLTTNFRKLLDETTPALQKRTATPRKIKLTPTSFINYDYFDFHYHYKRVGGTQKLDEYVNNQLNNLYLTGIGIYQDKATYSFSPDGDTILKSKLKVVSRQEGIVRTNCLDCLDRTNVFQTKICIKVVEDALKGEHGLLDISRLND